MDPLLPRGQIKPPARSTRLARYVVDTLRRQRSVYTAAMVLIIWIIGVAGYMVTPYNHGLLDAAYRSLQLFALASDDTGLENAAVQFARFAAGLALIYGVLLLIGSTLWLRFRVMVQSWERGLRPVHGARHVLLGLGEVNLARARYLLSQDHPPDIIAADGDFDPERRARAAELGLLLVSGNLRDAGTYRKLRLKARNRLWIACGEDTESLAVAAVATACRQTLDPPAWQASGYPVNVHISDVRLANNLNDASEPLLFHAHSLKSDAATLLLRRAHFSARAHQLGQERVHLVLAGLGDQGLAIAAALYQMEHVHGLALPRLTVLDCDRDAARARLSAYMPYLFDQSLPETLRAPKPEFHAVDLENPDLEEQGIFRRLCPPGHRADWPTAYVLACRQDRVNLSAGLALERAMLQLRLGFAPIWVRAWENSPLSVRHAPLGPARAFGALEETTRHSIVSNAGLFRLAVKIHATYDPELGSFDNLPENMKRSNLRAALHMLGKLADLDLRWRGMDRIAPPRITEDLRMELLKEITRLRAAPQDLARPARHATIRAVARTEHLRWIWDRAHDRWRFGSRGQKKSSTRRLHPDMVPFDFLNPDDMSKDLDAIETMVKFMNLGVISDPRTARRARVTRVRVSSELPQTSAEQVAGATDLLLEFHISGRSAIWLKKDAGASLWSGLTQLVTNWAADPAASRLNIDVDMTEADAEFEFAEVWNSLEKLAGLCPDDISTSLTIRD